MEKITISGSKADIALESPVFKNWLKNIEDARLTLRAVHFQAVDIVGSAEQPRVLFIKLHATIFDKDENPLPGSIFLRGGAVTILEILNCADEEYCILTLQPRVPVGSLALPELPAGMLDGSNNFSGTAARELKEEAGIMIKTDDLFDLTEAVYGTRWPGVYPSPGGCDEFLRIFLDYRYVTRKVLLDLQGKLTGLAEEHEHIVLKVIPLSRLVSEAPDAKALSALALYNTIKDQGKLNSYLRTRRCASI